MAQTYSQKSTLEVYVKDTHDHDQTFHLDNPKFTGITLTAVKAAFAHVIDASSNLSGKQLIYSNSGYPISEVIAAQRKVVTTQIEDLPNE